MVFSSIIPVLFIVLVVLIVVGIKVESKKGGEEVIKKVYIYLVLFATLMMTIGGSVAAFMAIADIITPVPSYHQSFEDFKRGMERPYSPEVTDTANLSEEELRARYDTMILEQRENQIARGKNSLVKSFGWIVIPLPIFIYFQRRLARDDTRKNDRDDE
ncbi:MAG: hypothetical protein Q7J85_14400 [Bacillota bacterium]|nr:hypothetical protein [Bacillota bacterium]